MLNMSYLYPFCFEKMRTFDRFSTTNKSAKIFSQRQPKLSVQQIRLFVLHSKRHILINCAHQQHILKNQNSRKEIEFFSFITILIFY